VSLTLLQAETNARTLTRHDADTRFSQTQWRIWANDEYRRMRTWLREEEVAPEFALLTSSDQAVALGATLALSAVSATLEGVHLVEWDAGGGQFRDMQRADRLSRSQHASNLWTFREQNGALVFGPDALFSGTVRVHYHNTPAALAADASTFDVPVSCELPLTLRTCGWIAVRDGEGAAGRQAWEDAADKLLKEALPALRARHGVHPTQAGLHVVMGY
jgi:hypothetical protein